MAVYVDNMYTTSLGNYKGMKMSHMMADTNQELLEMAEKIKVNKKWIQYQGTGKEHFDICLSKRQLAVENGAIEVEMRKLARAVVMNRTSNNQKIEI